MNLYVMYIYDLYLLVRMIDLYVDIRIPDKNFERKKLAEWVGYSDKMNYYYKSTVVEEHVTRGTRFPFLGAHYSKVRQCR